MDLITVIILRAAERIIGILIGGLLTWLGFRLFLDVQAKATSTGKFEFPGGTVIHLTRVGPGVFFSLFGSSIIFISFLKPVDFKKEGLLPSSITNSLTAQAARSSAQTISYSAAQSGTVSPSTAPQELRSLTRRDISVLNRIPDLLKPSLGTSTRDDITLSLNRTKLHIMERLWAADWGDFKQFSSWAGSTGAPPPQFVVPATYFNTTE